MNPEPINSRIQALHTWYCAAMGVQQPLNQLWERMWFDWLKEGYNGPQLKKVIRYLRREISTNRRNPGSLKLSNLLQPEKFAEDLVMATAKLDPDAKLPPLPDQSTMEGTRSVGAHSGLNPQSPIRTPKSPEQFARDRAFMKKCREDAGV